MIAALLKKLTKIDSASKALLRIINEILDFSKIEAGKLEIEIIEFDMDSVIENISNLLAMKAANKGIEFLISISPDVPNKLEGDSLRIEQVLVNLINNAIKFTNEGEVLLEISTLKEEDDRVNLRFKIKDTGIGITKEHMDRLFTSFSQADGSTTRKFGGTGLGLTISKRLVQMMGGDIQVTSEPKVGSEFVFNLWLKSIKGKNSYVPTSDIRKLNVLIVDDNETACDIMESTLKSFNYNTEIVYSGSACLEVLKKKKKTFDLVLLDWKMPGMDGIETRRKIQEIHLLKEPKMIMVTAFGREEIMNQADIVGFDGFLLKPFSPSLMFDTIMEAFHKKKIEQVSLLEKKEGSELFSGIHILLVEDSEFNQIVAKEILENVGCTVSLAENGKIALEMLQQDKYDLVLMDIHMPVMDGYEATQKIRQIEKLKSLPILAMTASAMKGDREKSIEIGMDDYITKPIDPYQLIEKIEEWTKIDVKYSVSTEELRLNYFLKLKGINTDAGLKRIGGNMKLYESLLNKFVDLYHKAGTELRMMLKNKDLEKGFMFAHTLKGVAGSIGAETVYEISEGIESRLRKNTLDEMENKIAQLEESLEVVIKSIRENISLEEKEEIASEKKVDQEGFKSLLIGLEEALKRRKPKEISRLLKDAEQFKISEKLKSEFDDMCKCTKKYKYPEAQDLISKILNKLSE